MQQRPDIFTINKSHPLAKGLVFAGLGSHAGSVRYHDSSGKGNHGELTNMAPATDWVSALGRSALHWPNGRAAPNSYVALGDSVKLGTGPGSIIMWFRCTSESDNPRMINWGANAAWSMFVDWTTKKLGSSKWSGSGKLGNTAVTLNAWNSACITHDGDLRFYLNGSPDGTHSSVSAANNDSLDGYIGWINLSGRSEWNGQLSDPLVYRRVLTPAEIRQLADPSNVMLSGLIQNPVRKWWPVSGGAPSAFESFWAANATQIAS